MRVAAQNKGWASLRGFWFSDAPWQIKRVQFLGRVLAPSIAALETYDLTKADLDAINTPMIKKLRALMMGAAATKEGEHGQGRANGSKKREIAGMGGFDKKIRNFIPNLPFRQNHPKTTHEDGRTDDYQGW